MPRSAGQPRVAALTLVVVAAALLMSCGGRGQDNPNPADTLPHTSLTVPGEMFPIAVGVPAPQVGVPIALGADTVICNEGDGAVTITDVVLTDATQNVTVEEFAVRPNGETHLGGEPGELKQLGFPDLSKVVDVPCGPPGHGIGFELGIQVVRTGPGPARGRGIEVVWSSGSRPGVLEIPLSIVLCDNPTATIDRCAPE